MCVCVCLTHPGELQQDAGGEKTGQDRKDRRNFLRVKLKKKKKMKKRKKKKRKSQPGEKPFWSTGAASLQPSCPVHTLSLSPAQDCAAAMMKSQTNLRSL